MSTEIKPGQVWAWRARQGDPFTIDSLNGDMAEYHYGRRVTHSTYSAPVSLIQRTADLVTDATPAPLDPPKSLSFEGYKAPITALDPTAVRAGDTVTLVGTKAKIEGEVEDVQKDTADLVIIQIDNLRFRVTGADAWTLTDHQPAPEPEPEWLFEFKGEEGPEGDEHWARRFPSRADALRSMIESANLDELNDFEGAVSFSVYTDETGPAEIPDICAHGQIAEDLCNAMPAKVELDAMWTAWKSLTPAEQRGWLEGGEGKVPTPAKVSIHTLMNGGAS